MKSVSDSDLMTWSVSPGLTSSEQQARTQSRSDRTTRASVAVVGLPKACLTLTITFWCCLEKHVSGSTADTGSDVISSSSAAARSGLSIQEGRAEAEGVMAAADQQSDQYRSASTAGENRSTVCPAAGETGEFRFIGQEETDLKTSPVAQSNIYTSIFILTHSVILKINI